MSHRAVRVILAATLVLPHAALAVDGDDHPRSPGVPVDPYAPAPHVQTADAVPVHAVVSREVAPGCVYSAAVQGTYRAPPPSRRADEPVLRDVRLSTHAELRCDGELLERRSQPIVLPASSPTGLLRWIHAVVSVRERNPDCEAMGTFGFDGGDLVARSVSARCERER